MKDFYDRTVIYLYDATKAEVYDEDQGVVVKVFNVFDHKESRDESVVGVLEREHAKRAGKREAVVTGLDVGVFTKTKLHEVIVLVKGYFPIENVCSVQVVVRVGAVDERRNIGTVLND